MKWINPRLDILPPVQQAVWPKLGALEHGFVLYGGTALALQYGHRESVDFDFFGEPAFDPETFKVKYDFLKNSRPVQLEKNTLSVIADGPGGKVKLSFFGALKFGCACAPTVSQDNLVRLASPIDLSVQKLKVIQVRSEVKDYLDLDCIFQNGTRLADALGAAELLYPGFSIPIALRALCYFQEGDVDTLPVDAKKRLIRQVNQFKSPSLMTKASEHLDIPFEELEELKKLKSKT